MSELEARKYTSIRNLREEIRQDMEDYKLLWTDEYVGTECGPQYLFNIAPNFSEHNSICFWFSKHLNQQIEGKMRKLKELVEGNNE